MQDVLELNKFISRHSKRLDSRLTLLQNNPIKYEQHKDIWHMLKIKTN